MKYRAAVIDISDPHDLGRIRVAITSFGKKANQTPWVWPCSPFAGSMYGWFFLPQIGDEVWVEQSADQDWIYTGFYWTDRTPKPEAGSIDNRVLRTPAGHQLEFQETGEVKLTHAGGSAIVLKQNGDISLEVADGQTVNLGGTAVEPSLLGNSFQARFNDLVNTFNAHTHIVPQQSSGTTVSQPPAGGADESDESDLCGKVKVE